MIVVNKSTIDRTAKALFIVLALLTILYVAGHIIFPLLFALVISLALIGASRKLESWGMNRFFGAFIPTITVTLVLVGLLTFLVIEGALFLNDLDLMSAGKTTNLIDQYYTKVMEWTGYQGEFTAEELKGFSKQLVGVSGNIVSALMNGLQSIGLFLGLIPIYVFFILMYRANFMAFARSFVDGGDESDQIGEESVQMIRKYLVGLVTVIAIVGILNSIGLFFIGLNHAFLIGFSTAILIVIPCIGSIVGALIPISIALISFDSPYYALAVLILYVVVQFVEGNFLSPAIVGKSVDLNPLVIIIGMIILGALGGVLALVIAVPLMAIMKILLSYTNFGESFNLLLQESEISGKSDVSEVEEESTEDGEEENE